MMKPEQMRSTQTGELLNNVIIGTCFGFTFWMNGCHVVPLLVCSDPFLYAVVNTSRLRTKHRELLQSNCLFLLTRLYR